MKTGDHVQDGNGRTFQVGQLLGRGMWGKCYLVREDSDASEWVLKVPLGEDDLPREPPRLAEACREIAREQGRLLEESGNEALAPVVARFIADDGSPAILMHRYPETLERRMGDAAPLGETLEIIEQAITALSALAPVLPVHGGIKPSNIMIDADGRVFLTDPITPTLKRHLPVLARREGYLGDAYLPQEVRSAESDPMLTGTADTFALAMTLYRAAAVPAEGAATPGLPENGLQKGDVQALKDRFHNRLKTEPSNPRFHARLADRAAAIVNRAISLETSPSPPYRFNRVEEIAKRLAEVTALVHPTIAHVGKLILNRPPANDAFSTDEEVRFSCTVGATTGVETHEEIAAGIAVFDQDSQERLRQIACAYTVDRHPSGRFRFSFRIADLPPGNYLVRVAYTIRDSGHEPMTAEAEFWVNAAPGYVPPKTETERQPIQIERPAENTVTAEIHPPGLDAADTTASTEDASVTPLHPNIDTAPVDSDPFVPAEEETTHAIPGPISEADPVPAPPSTAAPIQSEEPTYQGAGRWSELPLPNTGQTDLPSSHTKPEPRREPLESGPVSELLARGMAMIRSDAYTLFLGAAGLIIVVLLTALWLLPSS
jgi:serine/threonine protein kinase